MTGVRCPHCPKSFNDNIAMQVHLFVNHQNTRDSPAASPSVNHTSIRNGERTVIASRASNTHPDAPQASPSSSSMSPRAISSREGSVGSSNTAEEDTFPCGLCNAVLSNRNVYKQVMLRVSIGLREHICNVPSLFSIYCPMPLPDHLCAIIVMLVSRPVINWRLI